MSQWSRIVAPIVVLIGAVAVAVVLVKTAARPKRAPKAHKAALVETHSAKSMDTNARISAMGTIVPSQTVMVRPEIQGRVVHQSPSVVPGGRVKNGEVLLRIDGRDYELAVKQAEASVQRSQVELKVEQGRRQIAEREWRLVGNADATSPEGKSLALREPQLDSAKANLASAESALERAALSVSRTTLRAPFNAMIKEEAIDIGQLVGPSNNLMTLVGTDTFWVQVSVPVADLPWMAIPGVSGDEGATAHVIQELGTESIKRKGRVIRLLGDLDPRGRMARVLVEVDNPLGTESGALPLLLGAYVRVEIEGRRLEGVFEVPRTALRNDTQVWVVDAGSKLRFRDVRIAWRTKDVVYVDQGIQDGDVVVTSRLAAPVPGMAVRTDATAQPEAPSPPPRAEGPKHEASVGRP